MSRGVSVYISGSGKPGSQSWSVVSRGSPVTPPATLLKTRERFEAVWKQAYPHGTPVPTGAEMLVWDTEAGKFYSYDHRTSPQGASAAAEAKAIRDAANRAEVIVDEIRRQMYARDDGDALRKWYDGYRVPGKWDKIPGHAYAVAKAVYKALNTDPQSYEQIASVYSPAEILREMQRGESIQETLIAEYEIQGRGLNRAEENLERLKTWAYAMHYSAESGGNTGAQVDAIVARAEATLKQAQALRNALVSINRIEEDVRNVARYTARHGGLLEAYGDVALKQWLESAEKEPEYLGKWDVKEAAKIAADVHNHPHVVAVYKRIRDAWEKVLAASKADLASEGKRRSAEDDELMSDIGTLPEGWVISEKSPTGTSVKRFVFNFEPDNGRNKIIVAGSTTSGSYGSYKHQDWHVMRLGIGQAGGLTQSTIKDGVSRATAFLDAKKAMALRSASYVEEQAEAVRLQEQLRTGVAALLHVPSLPGTPATAPGPKDGPFLRRLFPPLGRGVGKVPFPAVSVVVGGERWVGPFHVDARPGWLRYGPATEPEPASARLSDDGVFRFRPIDVEAAAAAASSDKKQDEGLRYDARNLATAVTMATDIAGKTFDTIDARIPIGKKTVDAFRVLLPFAAQDEVKYGLTHIHVQDGVSTSERSSKHGRASSVWGIDLPGVLAVTTDGHRLAAMVLPGTPTVGRDREIAPLVAATSGGVCWAADGGVSMSSRVVVTMNEGSFPAWEGVVPFTSTSWQRGVLTHEQVVALSRIAPPAGMTWHGKGSGKNKPVHKLGIIWNQDGLIGAYFRDENGDKQSQVIGRFPNLGDIKGAAKQSSSQMGFDGEYFVEAFKALALFPEPVTFGADTVLSPFILVQAGRQPMQGRKVVLRQLQVVMPMRID